MKRSAAADLPAALFRETPARRLALLKAAWPAAVGPELARRSEVVALDGDLARIRVADAMWRRSLWRMRKDLIGRLRRVAGSAAPYALTFVEGPVATPVEATTPEIRVLEPAPLPPVVADAAELIPDDATRRRFQDAVGRYLARFPPQTGTGEADDPD
ncbi:MAG: DUF721 domain-containing protein [Acidobacteria bacterium]|jgi:hypothetical protein|nr:DUF721 domain-containing protein [Acidobacteriota bacterium]